MQLRPVIDPALSSIRISRNNNNERYTCVYIYIIINTILAGTDFSSYIYMRERPKISTSLFFCKSNKVENITCFYSSLEILWLVYVCIIANMFFLRLFINMPKVLRALRRGIHMVDTCMLASCAQYQLHSGHRKCTIELIYSLSKNINSKI